MFLAQAFFLWMFLSTAGLERLADAGRLPGADPAILKPLAYRYAAEWRHGLSGFWPVYVPGFFAAAMAAWFWSFGRPLRVLVVEGALIMAAALIPALAMSSVGTKLVLRDFLLESGVAVQGGVPGPDVRAIAVGLYTLLAWNIVVLSIHRAVWLRSWWPLAVPVVFDTVLILVRPFTFGDLVALWAKRVLTGDALAIIWMACVPLAAAFLVWRQRAWERRAAAKP